MYCKSTLKANTDDIDSIKKTKPRACNLLLQQLLKGIEFLFDDGIEKEKKTVK